MNVDDYIYLINNPEAVKEKQADTLGSVLNEFPYFQSARALRLKGLYNQKSFKYNYALKVTAAHTTDRAVLFDFITSNTFTAIQKEYYDKKLRHLLNITVFDSEVLSSEENKEIPEYTRVDPVEQSILTSIKEATSVVEETEKVAPEEPEVIEKEATIPEEHAETVTSQDFSINETHSFQEWLQLSRMQPIDRTNKAQSKKPEKITIVSEPAPEREPTDEEKKKKAEIIDKFIEANPKISPIRQTAITPAVQLDINKEDNSYLMTETLARVYLEQKKYTKAIQAYEILILKYPEKISFFADRISDIKILQQNNNNNN